MTAITRNNERKAKRKAFLYTILVCAMLLSAFYLSNTEAGLQEVLAMIK